MATETKTFYPGAYDASASAVRSVTGAENPVGKGSDNTTYATIGIKTGRNIESYIFWPFNLTSIPNDAEINSVSCQIKGGFPNSAGITSAQARLYSGAVAKGEQVSVLNTPGLFIIYDVGTWTRAELSNCRLRIGAYRGTTNVTSTINFYFYGADLIVTYTYQNEKFVLKLGGSWHGAARVFKKVNGIWVEQTELQNVIEDGARYQNGGEIESTAPATKTVTITGEGKLNPGTSSSVYCYLEINGVQYYTATTLSVNPGTQILIHVSGPNNSIIIDGEAVVDKQTGVYTHTFTVDSDCTIALAKTTYGGNVTVTTT